jgi:hypothetical protein
LAEASTARFRSAVLEGIVMAIDIGKLEEFLGQFTADLGATVAAGNVVIGHRLGLYQALAAGPADAGELAARTGTSPRYVAEWLCVRGTECPFGCVMSDHADRPGPAQAATCAVTVTTASYRM